jgi:predicted nucleic acid-binding protein
LDSSLILVDTSVWIDHLRRGLDRLVDLLMDQRVAAHPFVEGELACGRLANRSEVIELIGRLPRAPEASHDEAMALVERWGLTGRGVGWVDVHLLASARIAGYGLWTRDRRLQAVAAELGLA